MKCVKCETDLSGLDHPEYCYRCGTRILQPVAGLVFSVFLRHNRGTGDNRYADLFDHDFETPALALAAENRHPKHTGSHPHQMWVGGYVPGTDQGNKRKMLFWWPLLLDETTQTYELGESQPPQEVFLTLLETVPLD